MTKKLTTTKNTTAALTTAPTVPLDQNPAAVYLAGLSTETSRNTMRQAMNRIAVLLNPRLDGQPNPCFYIQWGVMRFQHVNAIKAQLATQYKPATVNKYLCALRGVLEAAKNLGQIGLDDYDKAVSVKSVKGSTLPAGRDLSDKEIRLLFAACENDPTTAGARDAAVFAVLRIGLRESEIVGLALTDFTPATGRLVVRGKGGKERELFLTNGSLQAVLDWLDVRGDESGALFVAISQKGYIERSADGQYSHMVRQSIFHICRKRAKQAKVASFSPHDFRRTFVGDMLDAGADIVTIKDMAGHASVTTTARYDRRGQQRIIAASNLLHTPYIGRRHTKMEG